MGNLNLSQKDMLKLKSKSNFSLDPKNIPMFRRSHDKTKSIPNFQSIFKNSSQNKTEEEHYIDNVHKPVKHTFNKFFDNKRPTKITSGQEPSSYLTKPSIKQRINQMNPNSQRPLTNFNTTIGKQLFQSISQSSIYKIDSKKSISPKTSRFRLNLKQKSQDCNKREDDSLFSPKSNSDVFPKDNYCHIDSSQTANLQSPNLSNKDMSSTTVNRRMRIRTVSNPNNLDFLNEINISELRKNIKIKKDRLAQKSGLIYHTFERINREKNCFTDTVELLDKQHEVINKLEYMNSVTSNIVDGEQTDFDKDIEETMKEMFHKNTPYHHQKENMPKYIQFTKNNAIFVEISSFLKYFPMHFTCNRTDLDLKYYISFNKGSIPTFTKYEQYKTGSSIQIQPAYKDLDKINCVIILIEATLSTKCVFSYNFTNPSYLHHKMCEKKLVYDYFSQRGKKELFGIPSDFNGDMEEKVYEQISEIKKKKSFDPKNIFDRNKEIAANINEVRAVKLIESNKDLMAKTFSNSFRSKELYDIKHKHKESLARRYEQIKEQKEIERKLAFIEKKKTMRKFKWVYFIKCFSIIIELEKKCREGVPNLILRKEQEIYVIVLQDFIRRYQRHVSWKMDYRYRHYIMANNSLMLFAINMKYDVRAKAIHILSDFFGDLSEQMKMFNKFKRFVGTVFKMQYRWKHHVNLKKGTLFQIKDQWKKEIYNLKEIKDKNGGPKFNNFQVISNDLSDKFFQYIVNRQIQNYVELRYAYLTNKRNDKLIRRAIDLHAASKKKHKSILEISGEKVHSKRLSNFEGKMSQQNINPLSRKSMWLANSINTRSSQFIRRISGLEMKLQGFRSGDAIALIREENGVNEIPGDGKLTDVKRNSMAPNSTGRIKNLVGQRSNSVSIEKTKFQGKKGDKLENARMSIVNIAGNVEDQISEENSSSNSSLSKKSKSSKADSRKSIIEKNNDTFKTETISKESLETPIKTRISMMNPFKHSTKTVVNSASKNNNIIEDVGVQEQITKNFTEISDSTRIIPKLEKCKSMFKPPLVTTQFKKNQSIKKEACSYDDRYEHKSLAAQTVFNITDIETNPFITRKIRDTLLENLEQIYKIDRNLLIPKKQEYNNNRIWDQYCSNDIDKIYDKVSVRVPDVYDKLYLNTIKNGRIVQKRGSETTNMSGITHAFTKRQLDDAQIDSYSAKVESREDFQDTIDEDGNIQNTQLLDRKILGECNIEYFKLNIKSKVLRALIISLMEYCEGKELI